MLFYISSPHPMQYTPFIVRDSLRVRLPGATDIPIQLRKAMYSAKKESVPLTSVYTERESTAAADCAPNSISVGGIRDVATSCNLIGFAGIPATRTSGV